MNQTRRQHDGDEGFMLIALVVAVFLILLALSVAAPRLANQLKRDREVETAHRANQYVRAIRMYYKKFQSYPGSMEALKKSNNQRFLRQEYVDPLTGEKDWKLIRVGQNKTKVKGFFGEDLPGLTAGLGSAAGLSSSGSSGSAFGTSPGSGSAFGSGAGVGSSSPMSGNGSTGGGTSSTGGTGSSGTSSGSGVGTGSGFGSSSLAGTGGPFMGVGVPKGGDAIVVVNEQTSYQDWEFLYDPRIEQMYAKGNLLGGGVGTSGSSSGLGSAGSLGGGFGAGSGAGTSGSGSSGSPGTGTGTPTTPPTTPP